MKKQYITSIVVVMAVALVGLTAIQFYWVHNAIGIKEQQFQEDVGKALYSVVYKVEKLEAANFINNNQLNGLAMGSMSAYILDANTNADSCCFNLPVTNTKKNDVSEYETSDGTIISRSRRELLQQCSKDKKKATLSQQSLSPFFHKSGMIADIINDLMNLQNIKVEERLDPEIIKILMEEEFTREGINTDFFYGVVSQVNGILLKEKQASDEALFTSPYKIKMFPGELSMYPKYLSVYFPNERSFLLKSMSGILTISVLFIGAIIFVFWYSLTVILKQKKLAIVKNDFINNMTHELKTPISTISLACEVLKDKNIPKNQERLEHYVEVINEENKRLGTLVENVLQSAVWDRPDFKLKKVEMDVHSLLKEVVERSKVQVESRQGEIILELLANDSFAEIDKIHFTNVLYNLIDNALKYTNENPKISICTKNVHSGLIVQVSDNGIGISKENQKKIFEKLYRVPTGNLHNVKGFGLGLSYVKAIVDQHGGEIQVKSQLGEGSTFSLFIPKNENYEHRKN